MSQPTSSTSTSGKRHHSTHTETFNQIVLMLILAFTFRVFVLEAFVIPTGSMAPTLMGAHVRYTCENCGFHFDRNYSPLRPSPTDINIPRVAEVETRANCPNCGYPISYEQTQAPRVFYGDRILVLKYLYLLQQPKRWDVVVFKTPSQPEIYHYGQAYIKRLIGKPGEQVMMLDGDIYVTRKSNPQDSDWEIQTKPEAVQNALWRIVHDIDYAPQGLDPDTGLPASSDAAQDFQPWKPATAAWKYSRDGTGARAFLFGNTQGSSALLFDPSIGPSKHSLTDFLAYDQQGFLSPVSDLKLSFFYTRAAGNGPLELTLSKNHDQFFAVIEPGKASLYRATFENPRQRELLATASYPFTAKPAQIDFINVDYRVRLLVDGKQVLTTTPQQYAPDVASLKARDTRPPLPVVGITADSQVCAITHLSLMRDVYYTQVIADGTRAYRGTPDKPVKLGPEEYFCLGDNSPLSADGRFWKEAVDLPAEGIDAQAGVVPERFLLGKALLVYWPAGFRLYNDRAPDLIPNFGEMRFIH